MVLRTYTGVQNVTAIMAVHTRKNVIKSEVNPYRNVPAQAVVGRKGGAVPIVDYNCHYVGIIMIIVNIRPSGRP